MARPRPSTSTIFAYAADLREQMLTEYRDLQEAEYEAACAATNGCMVNERGQKAGWSSWQVLYATPTAQRAYASDELLEHLQRHPRTSRTAFERQWLAAHVGARE